MNIDWIAGSTTSYRSVGIQFTADDIYVFADITQFNKLNVFGEVFNTISSTCSVRGYRSGEKVFDHLFELSEQDYTTFITAIYCGNPNAACSLIVDIIKEIINEPVAI